MKFFRGLTKRSLLIGLHDALATAAAVYLSFLLRFGETDFPERLPLLLVILPYFVVFSVVVCYVFRLTTTKWRFTSLPEILNIVKVSSILSIALLVLDYIFVAPNVYGSFYFGKTTIVIYWLLEIALLSGSRLIYRYYRTARTRTRALSANATPVLLLGNAADAELLIRSIESGAVRQIWPMALLSPSLADRGQMIRGLPVIGGLDDIKEAVALLSRRGKAVERIVMMPSSFRDESRPEHVIREARSAGLIVSRLPSLEDSYEQPRLTPVAVEDLLLRPTVKIDYGRLEDLVKGKSIVVTGGGGSIGAEICNRIVAFGAARLMILEHSEPALYAVMETLSSRRNGVAIDGRIADIRERERVVALLGEFKPDIVFHAAALKHVPILERDFGEGVKTNIFGTINVADASLAAGARAMVMISTDKAIEPVSMLGLTKRFAEMYCQARDHELARTASARQMRLISVRFGNVLASNGSVVPKFKAQIEAGGPVTVTHPDMVRYFMTIREACDLVITSASHALSAATHDVSVYVLNMGQPVRIADLAERLIRLSGLIPGEDIEIVYTGIRPGERLHEILFTPDEPPTTIGIEGITAAKPDEPLMASVQRWIEALRDAERAQDHDRVRAILQGAIPEFRQRSEANPPVEPIRSAL
ncbi:nucleoside-diphosphate sugar epimerase/dehydratase [Bradyrhizobium sp. LHD-71]|uniref:polysaccharide biosynthesis protein n=1 Tax=Bradyrhizobium sp. LHD-71 TaxID=3072141 RepID=UPI00280F065C|nr:nucleoside-diphosphate sugar epimerase/dehydratase [Bradyrhizobium sp. LHD-71]MDQ8728374.1 nucleoside-diphosphate sugar epimerase/dehydratase [Bradyrhizobium sp. LHD-71]